MPLTQEQLNKVIVKSRESGIPEELIQRFAARDLALSKQEAVKPSGLTGVLPVVGGIAGAALGTALGPAGTIGGGAVGSALGEALRQRLTGVSEPSRIATEAVWGLAGGAAGRVIGGGVRAAAGAGRSLFGKGAEIGAQRVASAVLKASPTAWANAAEHGMDLNQLFIKYAPGLGKTWNEILGPVERATTRAARRRAGGNVRQMIESAERIIEGTIRGASKNLRFSGDDIIKALRNEYRILGTMLGEETRQQALGSLIEGAEKKYAKGITVATARRILKTANRKFGKSILETAGDAVARSSQKLEGNMIRSLLRSTFPTIGNALDKEMELITLQEVLTKARSYGKVGGLKLPGPGEWLNLIFQQPAVGTRVVTALSPRVASTPLMATVAKGAQMGREQVRKTVNSISRNLSIRGLEQFGVREFVGAPSALSELTPAQVLSEDKQWQFGGQGWEEVQTGAASRQQFTAAMMFDLMSSGGKNITKLKAMYDFMNPQGAVSATQMSQVAAIKAAEGLLDEFDETVRKIGFKKFGPAARISGPLRLSWANAGLDPILYEYMAFREASASRLSRALGEVGNLREEDIQRAVMLLPMPTDSLPEAMLKLKRFRSLVEGSRKALEQTISQYKGFQISGVPATPAEVSF